MEIEIEEKRRRFKHHSVYLCCDDNLSVWLKPPLILLEASINGREKQDSDHRRIEIGAGSTGAHRKILRWS